MANNQQRIIPMLAYEDAPAAIEFLISAFGFEKRFEMKMPDGKIGHAELVYGDNVVMLASAWHEGGLASPSELPALHVQLYCIVDDVEAHYARAKSAGATLIGEVNPQFHGARAYRALDLEGHRWIFATPHEEEKTPEAAEKAGA